MAETPLDSARPIVAAWRFSVETRWDVPIERDHVEITSEVGGSHERAVDPGVRAGVTVASIEPVPRDDVDETEVLVLGFDSEPITGIDARLLVLLASSPGTRLEVRHPEMRIDGDRAVVALALRATSAAAIRWAYARHPAPRSSVLAPLDDREAVIETNWLERSDLPDWLVPVGRVGPTQGWESVEIPVPSQVASLGVDVERAERLLDHLDRRFRVGAAWRWPAGALTDRQLGSAVDAFERETGGEHRFRVWIEWIGGELVHRRRVEPLVRRPVEIVDETGRRSAGSVGVS